MTNWRVRVQRIGQEWVQILGAGCQDTGQGQGGQRLDVLLVPDWSGSRIMMAVTGQEDRETEVFFGITF